MSAVAHVDYGIVSWTNWFWCLFVKKILVS